MCGQICALGKAVYGTGSLTRTPIMGTQGQLCFLSTG
jgi:hypothetical protein